MKVSLVGAGRASVFALATVCALVLSGPVFADTPTATYNDAVIDIHGGNASAFGSCVKFAKIKAQQSQKPKSNACANFATANGGTVDLTGVSVFVDQEGSGRRTHNNVKINISGGDATAVASCVNFLQGTASSSQVEECKVAPEANGGDVNLNNVDITVIQLG